MTVSKKATASTSASRSKTTAASKTKSTRQVTKTMNLRFPKDLWVFLKHDSVEREMSFNALVVETLTRYKEKRERI